MTDRREQGTCFGFAVRSELPFRYLRGGDGATLEVLLGDEQVVPSRDRLVCEWIPNRDPPFHARLYEDGHTYRFWVDGLGTFAIHADTPAIHVPRGGEAFDRETRLWGIPALLCFLPRGDLPLHAAAVEIDGKAVVLAAPGTFGKTTLAAACVRAGHRLLGEDMSCVRNGGEPAVIPGPAALRLRRDVAERLELEVGEALDGRDGRVHVAVDGDRGDCAPVPLGAVVFLRIGEEITLERAPTPEAMRDLWALSFGLPGAKSQARRFAAVTSLADSVRVWNLQRPLRIEALEETVARVAAAV